MTRSYLPLLFFLAAIWGASYMFIKVAVDEIEPAAMMFVRTAVAAVLLAAFLAMRDGARALREVRDAWAPGLVLGVVNAALPFTLIAWGEKHIDSGVAAIANASVPIFVVPLAIRLRPSEPVTGVRLAGIVVGPVGVASLSGGRPGPGCWYAAG